MPELPEVETVRRQLEAVLKGTVIEKTVTRRGDLRIPFPKHFTSALKGRKIASIGRRAKYLLFYLDGGDVLIAHLGMTGRFSVLPKAPETFAAHDHVILYLKDGRCLIFNDARRFGLMALAKKSALAKHPFFAGLGPEPFDKSFSPAYLKTALAKRSGPIKPALMDQKLVVGVGNIYASEALFLAGISPKCRASKAAIKAPKLISCIRLVLKDAIASGGSSLRDFVQVSGEAGYFQHRFNVYGRKGKPCLTCKSPIHQVRQSGRATFFCVRCQK